MILNREYSGCLVVIDKSSPNIYLGSVSKADGSCFSIYQLHYELWSLVQCLESLSVVISADPSINYRRLEP